MAETSRFFGAVPKGLKVALSISPSKLEGVPVRAGACVCQER